MYSISREICCIHIFTYTSCLFFFLSRAEECKLPVICIRNRGDLTFGCTCIELYCSIYLDNNVHSMCTWLTKQCKYRVMNQVSWFDDTLVAVHTSVNDSHIRLLFWDHLNRQFEQSWEKFYYIYLLVNGNIKIVKIKGKVIWRCSFLQSEIRVIVKKGGIAHLVYDFAFKKGRYYKHKNFLIVYNI